MAHDKTLFVSLVLASGWLAGIAWGLWTKRLGLSGWQRALTALVPALFVRVALATPLVFLLEQIPEYHAWEALTAFQNASRGSAGLSVAGALLGVLFAARLDARRAAPVREPPAISPLGLAGLVFTAWSALAAVSSASYDRFLQSLVVPRCIALSQAGKPCESGWLPARDRLDVLTRLQHMNRMDAFPSDAAAWAQPYHALNQALWWGERIVLVLAVGLAFVRWWSRVERVLWRALFVCVLWLAALALYCVARGRADGLRESAYAGVAQGFVALAMLSGSLACGSGCAVLALRKQLELAWRGALLVAAMACGVTARFALERSVRFRLAGQSSGGIDPVLLRFGDERALMTLAALSLVLVLTHVGMRRGAFAAVNLRSAVALLGALLGGGALCLASVPYAQDASVSVGGLPSPRQVVVDSCRAPWRYDAPIVGDSFQTRALAHPASFWSSPDRVQELAGELSWRLRPPEFANHPELPPDVYVVGFAALPALPIAEVRGALQGMVLARDPMLVVVVGQSVRYSGSRTLPELRQVEDQCAIGRFLVSRKAPPRTVSTLGELLASSAPFNPLP